MTKVIKGKFKKLMDVKIKDVLLTCDTSLEVFHNEFTRLCSIDDDLFTYEVEVINIPCDSNIDDDLEDDADDDMGYDPSDVTFIECDEESFDNEYEVGKVFRIDTSVFNYEKPLYTVINEFNYLLKVDLDLLTKDIMRFKTYDDYKNDWIYEWNTNVPWVSDTPWLNEGIWMEPEPVMHTCKPFNYKTGCSEWPTCSGREDGFCNGGNLPGTYIVENQLHYQDLEWYKALEDTEQKEESLRNKAIIESLIDDKHEDDMSRYELRRRWEVFTNYDDAIEANHDTMEYNDKCEIHDLPVCNIRRFVMIKYSFEKDEEYVAIKEDEYDDLTIASKEACQSYQEIFHMMEEGWIVIRAE
ncbi:hypothetical protein Tco_1105256 [Tanacetum coccineum]